jgi:hypothetical protein
VVNGSDGGLADPPCHRGPSNQIGELDKVLHRGYPIEGERAMARRDTGWENDDERNAIIANPPDDQGVFR